MIAEVGHGFDRGWWSELRRQSMVGNMASSATCRLHQRFGDFRPALTHASLNVDHSRPVLPLPIRRVSAALASLLIAACATDNKSASAGSSTFGSSSSFTDTLATA